MKITGAKLIVLLKHKGLTVSYDTDTQRYYKENEDGEVKEITSLEFNTFKTYIQTQV